MKKRETVQVDCAALLLFGLATGTQGGVIEFEDRDAWINAVGAFTTIDFTGFPLGTFITDQYANLGILFTDGNDSIHFTPSFVNDGWGLDGNGDITVYFFDTPMAYIGVDYPGHMHFDLYRHGVLIYESSDFLPGGVGNFAGLVSSELFDAAVLMDVPPVFEAAIDDLHFGVATCPSDLDADGAVGIFDLLILLGSWGPCPDPPDPCPADLDGDGTVGILDLLTLLANWGKCP